MPEDENDLAYFLRNLPAEIPVTVIGAGSNLIVRDGGVPGVVIRLGRGFNEVKIEDGHRVTRRHRRARRDGGARGARAGIAGLAFFSGIPGTIGGALRMNGGAYGGETKDVLVEARGVDRQGNVRTLQQCRDGLCLPPLRRRPTMSSSPARVSRPRRRCRRRSPPKWTRSRTSARRASRATAPAARPSRIRPATSAWKLIDDAGCRGLDRRRRAGLRAAQQFPDQSRRRQRAPTSRRWARPCASG